MGHQWLNVSTLALRSSDYIPLDISLNSIFAALCEMSLFRSTAIQYMTSYSDKTALWFHRPTALNQPLFQMPVLGYINGSQALLLFGVGLPTLFGMMSIFDVWISVIPFCVIVILSVIRPPVLGYEGRLAMMILFHMKRRQSTPKRRCDALVIPKRKKINNVSATRDLHQ
ncbi:MAG: hypothetical protein F4Y18_01905 [Cenarchaeum sp. SB0663_bin_5]|nr:hypothetical protein [Cenarchaeum sp. SB0663_bin_5]MYH03889.1 hypothetical protein [Cenarchaeum sp. SB0675_bin_21]MYL11566.1 hypothetical protein [Cenarchaeum sp. SB0669_bin_11]